MEDFIFPVKIFLHLETRGFLDFFKMMPEIMMSIISLIFGILLLRITKKIEQSQWRSQKLIEKRITEWDAIRSDLNDIFCYCARVGGWKEFSPIDIIQKKRATDKKVHLARPYFSSNFFESYLHFIEICFSHYQGHGVDAKIKTSYLEHKSGYNGEWDESWKDKFHDDHSSVDQLHNVYDVMIEKVSEELEIRRG